MPGSDLAQQSVRLVGLAVAGADLVFEISDAGSILFALGAAEYLTGIDDDALVGCGWNAVLDDQDVTMMAAIGPTVSPGERQGPFRVRLRSAPGARPARTASLSVFRLPQRGANLSCALSATALDVGAASDELADRDGFCAIASDLMRQARKDGLPLRLDLVELEGYGEAMAALPTDMANLRRKIVGRLLQAQAIAGGASEIAEGRFAILRDASVAPGPVAEQLEAVTGIKPAIADLKVDLENPTQALKAMRYALDCYIAEGADASVRGFEATLNRVVQDAARFRTRLANDTFQLAFQPIVTLGGGLLHHFEALARFDPDVSPADTIRMAEELDMIVDFDLAVVRCACRHLAAHPHVSIAVNVSGASLLDERFLSPFLKATSGDPSLRGRLLIELTETAAVRCLEEAAATLKGLRDAGFRVCIDDFGAGSASLEYLSALEVDIVKFDGRFVRDLERGSRNYILLKHLAGLCKALGAETVAEMVETPLIAALLAEVGIEYGQGWYFGMPLNNPNWDADRPWLTRGGLSEGRPHQPLVAVRAR